MTRRLSGADVTLTAVVLVHFAISAVHGFAHTRANVLLAPAALAFVFTVILAGPLVGLVLRHTILPRTGAWIIAATLTASLVFGLVNHFVMDGADHVMRVVGSSQTLFGVTAALLAISEALGAGLAVHAAEGVRGAGGARVGGEDAPAQAHQ